MKNRILLSLILLLSTGRLLVADTGITPSVPTENDQLGSSTEPTYAGKKSIVFIRDFFDLTKHPDKPFKWWVAHLYRMIKGKEEYNTFLREFHAAYRAVNLRRVEMAFLEYQKAFGPEAVKLIKKIGVSKVREILAQRFQTE